MIAAFAKEAAMGWLQKQGRVRSETGSMVVTSAATHASWKIDKITLAGF